MKAFKYAVVAAVALAVGGCAGYATSQVAQPHMENALASLRAAKSELAVAEHNKGGHRVKAMGLIDGAIGEVQAGIGAAN